VEALDAQKGLNPGRNARSADQSQDVSGAYNAVFNSVLKTGKRTSMIIDPPDGRIPPLVSGAQEPGSPGGAEGFQGRASDKHRWIIERDYQELKQELGLGHYEGRGWRGFHHHATLCIVAYGFLVAERSRFSPSAQVGNLGLPTPEPPPDFRPRGSPRSSPSGIIRAPSLP
jgi:hypothetical protein